KRLDQKKRATRILSAWPPWSVPLTLGLACCDFPAPGAVLGAAGLDQFLEPLEVAPDTSRVEAGGCADGLDRIGLIAHREADKRLALADRLERDGAARLLSVLADPADLPVGMLLEDLCVPLGLLAGDVRDPVQARVVELLDVLDAFHEEREVLELRPLVVRHRDGDVDLDRLVDRARRGTACERHARQAPVTATLERYGDGAADADGDEDRVAELVTALPLDARPRAIDVPRHLDELVLECHVGSQPCRGGDEAKAARGPATSDRPVAHCRQELLAELPVLRERSGVIGSARGAVFQYL